MSEVHDRKNDWDERLHLALGRCRRPRGLSPRRRRAPRRKRRREGPAAARPCADRCPAGDAAPTVSTSDGAIRCERRIVCGMTEARSSPGSRRSGGTGATATRPSCAGVYRRPSAEADQPSPRSRKRPAISESWFRGQPSSQPPYSSSVSRSHTPAKTPESSSYSSVTAPSDARPLARSAAAEGVLKASATARETGPSPGGDLRSADPAGVAAPQAVRRRARGSRGDTRCGRPSRPPNDRGRGRERR